jgi:hypothetical protein
LTQSAREWWTEVNSFLVNELKFRMFNGDWGLYGRKIDSDNHVFVLVYVDDILVVGRHMDVEYTITTFKRKWVMTDAGSAKWILGIHVQRTESTLCLSQQAYIESIAERFKVEGNRPISTPLEANLKVLPSQESDLMMEQQKYQSLIGALMWLSLGTRPDITYAVNVLARYNGNPSRNHYNEALRVLRYVNSTKTKKLTLTTRNETLVGFTDADWAGDRVDFKSTSGYVFYFEGLAVSWTSMKQNLVAQSSTESEYIAMAAATNEATYLVNLLEDFGFTAIKPVLIHCDNKSAMTLADNPAYHKRSKHFGIRLHVTRSKVQDGTIRLTWVSTTSQVADIFTKALPRILHEKHTALLGVL